MGQVHVTLSRSSAVASLAADVMRCGPLKHLGIAWFFWLPLGQVHVTLSRIAAVASLAADELNTASSLLEITLAYSLLPLRFAKLSKIASHNSPGCPSSNMEFRYCLDSNWWYVYDNVQNYCETQPPASIG